jgi:hypothetical protein
VAPPALAAPAESRGVAWADYDNDADLDLYVCRNGSDLLLRNDGGEWTDVSTDRQSNSTGCAWGDAEGDGDLDLYQVNWDEPNQLFVNTTVLDGSAPPAPRLFVGSLRGSEGAHWAHFDLEGPHAGAIGARVRIFAGGTSQIREVSGGAGLGSQDSPRVEFGLGSITLVDSVEVRWSSGIVQKLGEFAADQVHTITESGGPTAAPIVTDAAMRLALHSTFPNPFLRETTIRFDLPSRGHVQLDVIDVTGRRIRTLVRGLEDAGAHSVRWDGMDEHGRPTAPGMYFCRLGTEEGSIARKLLHVR